MDARLLGHEKSELGFNGGCTNSRFSSSNHAKSKALARNDARAAHGEKMKLGCAGAAGADGQNPPEPSDEKSQQGFLIYTILGVKL